MDLDLFAEHFTKSIPINALVYDNRCFGASDGMPRFEIIPSLQISDIQDAITFAQSLPEVDPEKIAIWGSSYSGAHVLQVAAFDRRVKAVLAQAPMVSGVETTHRVVGSMLLFLSQSSTLVLHLGLLLIADRAARMRGEEAGTLPVVTDDPMGISALPGQEAYDFFQQLRQEKAPTWENKITIKRFVLQNLLKVVSN
jgi:uncharacterized protein